MTGDCADCNHAPAYHDGEGGRTCRAWNPDEVHNMCSCTEWKKGTPVVVKPVEPKPDKYWTE